MPIQSFSRGLRQMKIASYVSPGSYGTAYTILGARSMSVQIQMESEELRGDDVVIDRHSKAVSATFTLAYASVDLSALDILLGGTLVSNASYEDFLIGQDDNTPYFAVAGRVVSSGGTTDLHLFAGHCKISGAVSYQAQLDTYIIPSLEVQAVYDNAAAGIMRFRQYTALTALEIPLRTTTGGL